MIESPRHELDQAIDRVATKLVAAPGGDGFLQQVIARLPVRGTAPWFMAPRVQLAAAAAVVLVAFLYARPSRETVPIERVAAKPVADRVDLVAPAPMEAARVVPTAGRRRPAPDPGPGREDHERSLPAVAAIEAIELGDIATPAMALDAPATVEPLVLTELVLDPKGDQ